MVWKRTICIALALLACGCMSQADSKAAADATTQFYQRVAAKQYGAIYDDAGPQLQSAMQRDVFIGMMQRVDRKLGACQPPVKTMDFNINATPSGTFISQGYTQACANGPLAQKLTLAISGGKVQVAGYWLNSPLLLTD